MWMTVALVLAFSLLTFQGAEDVTFAATCANLQVETSSQLRDEHVVHADLAAKHRILGFGESKLVAHAFLKSIWSKTKY